MWPWGHLAVGYILYSGISRLRWQRPPTEAGTILVAFGSQFPDLVDKPIAWTFGVLPTGRSLTHSLFTASLILGILFIFAQRSNRIRPMYWTAFALGYLSHLATDALHPLLTGEVAYTAFLVWPVMRTPPYETPPSFLAHFTQIQVTPYFGFQLLCTVGVLIVWRRDGAPGIHLLQSELQRTVSWVK